MPHGEKVEHVFVFRDLRTTFKTSLLETGVDKAPGDTILVHRLKGMVAHYLKPMMTT